MTRPTTLQLATRLQPWISVSPPELPPASVLEHLEAEAQANRQGKPDDARAISLVTAVRSMRDARRKLDAGSLEDVDVQLAMRCLGMFVATLRAQRYEPG